MYKFNIGDTVFIYDEDAGMQEPYTETIEEISLRHGEIRYNGRNIDILFSTEKEAWLFIKSRHERKQKECFELFQEKIDNASKKIESL